MRQCGSQKIGIHCSICSQFRWRWQVELPPSWILYNSRPPHYTSPSCPPKSSHKVAAHYHRLRLKRESMNGGGKKQTQKHPRCGTPKWRENNYKELYLHNVKDPLSWRRSARGGARLWEGICVHVVVSNSRLYV